MQNKRRQASVGQMIQRCHKGRQKRKQYIDQARQTNDIIERERLLQSGEHFARLVSSEQGKIDLISKPEDNDNQSLESQSGQSEKSVSKSGPRSPRKKAIVEKQEDFLEIEEDSAFPDFIVNI